MINRNRQLLFAGLGSFVTVCQAYILLHDLIEGKPYKVVDPANVFFDTACIGVPVSLLLCGSLLYFMLSRIDDYLLPMVPVLSFPIFMWIVYQTIFLYSGVEIFSGSGDFSPRDNELEFAHDVVQVLLIGCVGGLLSVGIGAVIVKWLPSETR